MGIKMKSKIVTVYLCGVDWQHELAAIGGKVWPSVKSLKKDCKCWKQCGIVKLNVTLDKWVSKQDFSRLIRAKKDQEKT